MRPPQSWAGPSPLSCYPVVLSFLLLTIPCSAVFPSGAALQYTRKRLQIPIKSPEKQWRNNTETILGGDFEKIPEEIKEQKYCYTKEKGFYLNKDYIEPINEEDRFTDIELALAEIYELIEGGK